LRYERQGWKNVRPVVEDSHVLLLKTGSEAEILDGLVEQDNWVPGDLS
jgi:hypothetical protein